MKRINANFILIVYFITLIVAAITLAIAITNKDNIQPMSSDYKDFSLVWYTEDGNHAELSGISGEYTVKATLPKLNEDDVLYFNIKSTNVDVYVENECVYETKVHNPKLFGYTAGSDFVRIPLNVQDSGKTIYLKLNNPYEDGSGKITQIRIGNGVDMLLDNVTSRIFGLCVSAIIAFIGFVFIIMFFPLWKHKIVGREMLYLGLFAFGIGMFMLADCKLPQEIANNAHIFHSIAELFMMLFITPLVLFFNEMYKSFKVNTKVMKGVCLFSLTDFVISYVLAITGTMDLHETVLLTHCTYIICILVLLILFVRNSIAYRRETKFHMLGILCLAIGGVADILFLNYAAVLDTTMFTRLGALLFMCLESTQIIGNLLNTYQKGIKAQLLEKLAYQDGLTELLNRTSFMEDIDKLKSESSKDVLVAIFDVNDLKLVNDTMGHTSGDEMLTIVANALNDSFCQMGSCYRIGGDEFALISNVDNPVEEYISAHKCFMERLDEINSTRKFPHKIVVASGYSSTDKEQIKSISEAINTADKRMYRNKKDLKEEQGKVTQVSEA